jgi:hypothetical protein
MRAAAALLMLPLWLLAAAPSAAQLQPSKCTALKYKAAGIYVQKLGSCRAKVRAGGDGALEEACAEKASAKLLKAFEKAERKGDCVTEGDEEPIQIEVDQFVESLTARLERQRQCCAATDVCFYAADIGDCASFGGTLGEAGQVCAPSGDCEFPPVLPGACCDNTLFGDFSCSMSPALTEDGCTGLAGTFEGQASCSQVDGCVPVP